MATRKKKRVTGRPTKCTETFLRRLEEALQTGANPRAAVLSLGVSPDSHRRWEERGFDKPKSIYGAFCRVLDHAHAQARVGLGKRLFKLAKTGDVPAANAWLKHVKAEGFEPQNVIGILHKEFEDGDDSDALRAELDRKVAGVSRALGA